ncbi:MAG: hypothetical protein NT150_04320 [Bacteroidetes bacterium]|nr:hypothetical protein [Bacteroidota bacterium]
MKYYVFFVLFYCGIAASVFAQNGPKNEMDDMYSPSNSPIFNSSNNNGSSSFSITRPLNTIKLSPFLFFKGIASVSYERTLSDVFSAQASLGYCFSRDYSANFSLAEIFGDINNVTTSISMYEMMNYGKWNAGSNFYFSLAGRAYFESSYSLYSWLFDWDESYIELNYRLYNYQLNLEKEVFPLLENDRVSIRNNSFNIILGQYYSTSGKIKSTHELYYGLSFLSRSFDIYKSDPITGFHQKTGERGSILAPMFIFGYNFGIGW